MVQTSYEALHVQRFDELFFESEITSERIREIFVELTSNAKNPNDVRRIRRLLDGSIMEKNLLPGETAESRRKALYKELGPELAGTMASWLLAEEMERTTGQTNAKLLEYLDEAIPFGAEHNLDIEDLRSMQQFHAELTALEEESSAPSHAD